MPDGWNENLQQNTVTDPSIVMEQQPQLPSPGLATFGSSDSAIAEEEGAGDVGLSMEGEVRACVRACRVGQEGTLPASRSMIGAWLCFGVTAACQDMDGRE